MPEIADIVGAIDKQLPEMARGVIRSHLDLDNAANQSFLERPDARDQHQTRWHQWGIITHTRMFLEHFRKDIPRYLERWGLWACVNEVLGQPIDGVGRWQLLEVTILLHDIGKFGARTRGRERFHFTRHEELSGAIIRRELDLERFGLSPAQVTYVARTAEDHFVLGLLRKVAREQGEYDVAFTSTPSFYRLCLQIKSDHPDDFVEIGVLFLGDSLSKANPQTGPESAVDQYDINIAVARRYLEVVLNEPTYNDPRSRS